MNQITSVNNPIIKEIIKLHQKKYRDHSSFFLVEGLKSYEEIESNKNIKIEYIFILKNLEHKIKTNLDKVTIVTEAVLKKLSTTTTPSPIIVVAQKPDVDFSKIKKSQTLALLENIRDPGNLGTIIRSAVAFNLGGLLIYGDSVDIYNPKVIRAATGNFFKVPILYISNISQLKQEFPDFIFVSTGLKDKKHTDNKIDFTKKNIIMFGSEAEGLSSELLNIASFNKVISMSSKVESLNLSVAAGILFYEIFKNHH